MYEQTIADVSERLDGFTLSMLKAERDKQIEQKEANNGFFDANIIVFPAPYNNDDMVTLNVLDDDSPSNKMYEIPKVDEYYGDFGFFDDLCYYGKYSDGAFGYSFDEEVPPESKDEFSDITGVDGTQDNLNAARRFFTGMIGTPIYGIADITKLQDKNANPILNTKLLNDWEEVDVTNLGNRNQILTALLGNTVEGDASDMWVTLIAFTGFAAHRTVPMKADSDHPDAYFVNDTTFLSDYETRPGYERYGAAAYFDAKYHLKEIYLSDSDTLYKAPGKDVSGAATAAQWAHAKWAWKVCINNNIYYSLLTNKLCVSSLHLTKVSASVAIFLVDFLAHSHFREANGFVKAIREKLPPDHNIRRLLLPFTLGTVKCNRVFNEFLREKGLYHRCFAFKYKELQRLIREAMQDAPVLQKGQVREAKDRIKYRFRLFRKKVQVMKKLPDEVYPLYSDLFFYWVQALDILTGWVSNYYNENDNDDEKLIQDKDAAAFYAAILENLKIDQKYRLKKFNFINVITHFICNATIWNHQCSSAVSFIYSVDPDFTGLKIVGNNAKQNNVIQYAEYCLVALSKGYMIPNIKPSMLTQPNDNTIKTGWDRVLPPDGQEPKTSAIFKKFFIDSLNAVSQRVKTKNQNRIAPYFIVEPAFLQASIHL